MKPIVLIVDDELDTLIILRILLESKGYDVEEAHNGVEALEKIKTKKPDLILLDVMMPEMDGYTVCRKIKSEKDTKNIAVILLTVRALSVDIEKGKKCGADFYITKPFDSYALLNDIHKILSKKKLSKA
ncbi:MAG: response regulator [Candidatus Firestonebacteria bacterium]